MRVVAFVAGGLVAWMIVHTLAPTWDEPLICFLVGGLVGLVLFRIWIMGLTSLAGTLLIGYSGLCLADHFGQVDAVAWADKQAVLMNWACIAVAVLGLLVQFLLDRRARRRAQQAEEDQKAERERRNAPKPRKRSWWNWGQGDYRRAG